MKQEQQSYTFEEVYGHQQEVIEEVINVDEFIKKIEDYGEWKELIGYLKGKNLNPKLVKKYIETVLEIEKLSV